MSGFKVTIAVLIFSLPLAGFGTAAVPDDQNDLLKARELVWRACFAIGCHFQGTFQQPPVPGLKPWAVICSHFAAKSDVPVRDAIPSIQDHFEFAVASE
jgi:hypothetical protein